MSTEYREGMYEDDWDFDDDEIIGDDICSNCGAEYDEIDQEYQICHICKYNNNSGE
jgi:predicted amidophosphoribosyltransferase